MARKQASQKRHHDLKAHMREMNIGQRVLAQNYRDGPRWVSSTIIQRNSPVTYKVKLKSGDVWKRHIDQLREKFDSPQECFEIPVPVNHDDANIIPATTVTLTESDSSEESVDSSSQVSERQEMFEKPPIATPSAPRSTSTPTPHHSPYPLRIRHPPDYFKPYQ